MASNLIAFTESALLRGLERDEIAQALRDAGWPKEEIAAALDAFAETDFPLPVPKPKPQISARETFVQLLFFSSFYICTWSFVSLIFTFIDRFLPSPLHEQSDLFNDIRLEISTLIVFFPLFVFMFRLANRAASDATRRASRVRRWFVYLTLFLAAVTFAGDAVTLIYSFLSGEFGTAFLLKILTIAFVAGSLFVYFLYDVRQDEQE
ncbi:MAG TPA: DUF5671 domain-containing protein [Methylocella sp.]|nr:DUF5671 domain-containing protein [Methylocella sp.]